MTLTWGEGGGINPTSRGHPRVWATVRSQQQIADNADRQVAADAEGLVSAWDFRETDFTDGGTVPDITGNHNGQWQFRGDGGGSSCHSMDSRIADLIGTIEANVSTLAVS